MTISFKSRFQKSAKRFALLFATLFLFRLLYGYLTTDSRQSGDRSANFFNTIDKVRKNYASEKFKMSTDVQQQSNIAANQKFEKTASIKSKSSEFENDERRVKEKTKSFNAVIQYEQNIGQKGTRQLHLLIGVNPTLFDSFYIEIQKFGEIKSLEITKVDKTNEYKQLNAKKASIQQTLQSLNDLKSKSGQISDFVTLNDKILEIQEKLQELGVELGNFDAENEFCTVKFSLYEGATKKPVSFIQRLKTTTEWTIKYYAILIFTILALSATIFLLLLITDKLKLINAVASKFNE